MKRSVQVLLKPQYLGLEADNASRSFLHVFTRFCKVIVQSVHPSRQDVGFQLIGAILTCTGL